MIICPNCGAQLNDDALFCGNCGIKFTKAPTDSSKDAFIARVNELCRMANELSVSYVDEMTAMETVIGNAQTAPASQDADILKELEEEKENNARLAAALDDALTELEAVKAEKNAVFAEVASLRAELDVMRLYAPEPSIVQNPSVQFAKAEFIPEPAGVAEPAPEFKSEDIPVIEVRTAEEQPVNVPAFCPECGNPVTPEMSFCRECGTKLK